MQISPNSTSSQFLFLKSLLLNATPKYSSTSHFQNFKQCISYITFLWCEIPIVLLEHIIRGKNCPSMHNFTVEIRNGSYMFQLHSSHQTIYGRSIKGNHVPIFYILLQMISGRYFGLTYKGR